MSVTITGDLFLQLISVNTSVLVRDVLVLDAYFFFFVLCGVALLYLTLPKPMVVRRPRCAAFPPLSPDTCQDAVQLCTRVATAWLSVLRLPLRAGQGSGELLLCTAETTHRV